MDTADPLLRERLARLEVSAEYHARELTTVRTWVEHLATQHHDTRTRVADLLTRQERNAERITSLEGSDAMTRQDRITKAYNSRLRKRIVNYALIGSAVVTALVGILTPRDQGIILQLIELLSGSTK